jgi:hypothetical protein
VLIDRRAMQAPALDASYDLIDLRTLHLRIMRMSSRRVSTDYTVLDRAMPYMHRKERPSLLLVLEGEARFDEGRSRRFLSRGDVVRSDARLLGTEAHAGHMSSCLAFEWDPAAHGAAFARPFVVDRLERRDIARLANAAVGLDGPDPSRATCEIIEILRAVGLAFDRPDLRALRGEDDRLQPLQTAISNTLASLERRPTIEDVESGTGWNARRVHRGVEALAKAYKLSWRHWREGLHQARLLHALRLLSASGATTDLVSRLTGFRGPVPLCHAFAEAGLPSPIVFRRRRVSTESEVGRQSSRFPNVN